MAITTKMTLILDALVIVIILPALFGVQYPLVFSYEVHKFLHILGAIFFLGNMMVGPVWLLYATLTKDLQIVRFALRLLGITDVMLSTLGMILLITNGLCLASVYGGIYAVAWIRDSILLLGVMVLLAITVVLHYQERLYGIAKTTTQLSPQFWRSLWLWSVWGSLVMLPPGVVLYLMVVKQVPW